MHYWTFDDNDSGLLSQIGEEPASIEGHSSFTESDFQSFGLLGRALELKNTEINASTLLESADQNFTVSFWAKPQGDFNFSIIDSAHRSPLIF